MRALRMKKRRLFWAIWVVMWWWWAADMSVASSLHMKMVYRYSEEYTALRRGHVASSDWPHYRVGSREHYVHLIGRDRFRHSRKRGLTTSPNGASLSPSNETAYFDTLGGLHYALVQIGTPSLTFLVALDTGSDLFWVPCDCHQCSSTKLGDYGLNSTELEFSVYSPTSSNTSKLVLCGDTMCSSTLFTKNCSSTSATCNYIVKYASLNTSTSGIIVQDLIYLTLENSNQETITTPIYFGCGEVQTGDLLNGGAPNGLFGLGPNAISIPSTLARNQIVSKSFSMCFSASDSSGRLVFGSSADKGLQSTRLLSTNPRDNYILSTKNLAVGEDLNEISIKFVFDTGTSFTIIPQPVYQELGQMFNKRVSLAQVQDSEPFDFCWIVSDSDDLTLLPQLSFTFLGGSNWVIQNPYVTFNDSLGNIHYICLGVLEGSTGIIGHNFMGGYEFFFDQDLINFSWKPSNCYDSNLSTRSPTKMFVGYEPSSSPKSLHESNMSTSYVSLVSFSLNTLITTVILIILF